MSFEISRIPCGDPSDPLLISITDADFRDRINQELAFCSMAVQGTVIRSEHDLDEARRLARRIEELDEEIHRTLQAKRDVIDAALSAWQRIEIYWRDATAGLKAGLLEKARQYLALRRRDVRKLEKTFELEPGTIYPAPPPQLRVSEQIEVELVSPKHLAEAVARGEACPGLIRLNAEYARMLASNRDIPGVKIKRARKLAWNFETTNGKP